MDTEGQVIANVITFVRYHTFLRLLDRLRIGSDT
jgi:hypothetical protein